jgi:hypothetical protein
MDFGIKCVTVCACDWLLFVFFYLYILHDVNYVLVICIFCDLCKWYCLETMDCSYPVDNSRELLGTNVGYYPVAHDRYLGEHFRVLPMATPISPKEQTNQSVTGNQRTTRITLK